MLDFPTKEKLKNFIIGVDFIDTDHRILVEMFESLYDAKLTNLNDLNTYLEIIKNISDYWVIHIADEDKFMNVVNYPKRQEHQVQHGRITKILESCIIKITSIINLKDEELFKSLTSTDNSMFNMLLSTLWYHLDTHDRTFTDYVNTYYTVVRNTNSS